MFCPLCIQRLFLSFSRLTETGFGSKKDYTVYLKDYMKKVVKYLEENDKASEVDEFKTNINKVVKDLLPKFKDLQFFTGEESLVVRISNASRSGVFPRIGLASHIGAILKLKEPSLRPACALFPRACGHVQ